MKSNLLHGAEQFYQSWRRKRLWHRIVSGLACVVVFCTVYALILPAITLENEPVCGLEEHTHSDECYTVELQYPQSAMDCVLESGGAPVIHAHDEFCYSEDGTLICQLPELEAHSHTSRCYREDRTLICTEEEDLGHAHSAACYARHRGELSCAEEEDEGHSHSGSCYETDRELTCTDESEDHVHDDSCYTETERLVCTEEERLGHTHSDSCYEWTEELTCTEEEHPAGHIHTDACYEVTTRLACGKEEVIPHTHGEDCYDESGALVCDLEEVLEHQHTDACIVPPEGDPWEVRVLTCGLEEHQHSEECRGTKESDTTPEVPVLTAAGEDYTVSVVPGSEAGLPENTELIATEIPEGSEEYETYFLQAETALQNAGATDPLVFARFFDLQLVSDGEPVEPAAPVSVSITYADMEGLESADCHAVHFAAEGVELLETTAEKNENGDVSVTHIQSSFSVVGNVVTQTEDSPISAYANAPTTGLDHNVTFMVKIRGNRWVNVGSCTYDTSAVDGGNASVSEDVLHQYLDNYGYDTESNPTSTLKCSYDDIYTIYYAQNGAATNFALDITNGNIQEKKYLQLWTANQTGAQTFRIWRVVDDYYFITPLANSGLHVNLENGATANGTRLWLHSALDEASWWGIRNNDDGTVSFYSQKKASAYIDVTDNEQRDGAVIELYENGGNIFWKPVKKYVEQDVVADGVRVGLTAESNGNIVCFYTPSTPLNDPNAIYTAEELSKLGTSGNYYLGCDITVDHVNGSAADIGDGDSTTLDLNGHTIHYNVPKDQRGSSMVYLHGTGSLTITDSGQAVETKEVVTDQPLYGNLASYDSSTKTLVYYVTESHHNGNGTTTETLVKHTVDLTNVGAVESDTAPYHLIFVANDAVLNIQGGRFTNPNGKRAITACDNSSVNISGGYLCGSTNYGTKIDGSGIVGGAVHVNSTGALNISGGVIAANRADKAGGVYKNNGTFTMTGGVISGNLVPQDANNGNDCRGGGVQIDNAATTISGGYITNNRLDYKCNAVGDGCHFGGGITFYNETLTISNNCYITGNYSAEAGGGIGYSGPQFIMTGGTVAANVAQTAEGGGIRIQSSKQTSLISGGYITNNRTNSMHDWGGGGIFLVQGNSLQIINAVFKQNTADGFGGGVGGCSTGQIVAVDNTVGGVAIFDNYANGETMSGSDGIANSKQDDLTAQANEVFMTNGYNDFFCALNSAVAGSMLGDGAENWHGSCDYQEIDIGKDDIVAANKMMGLNANPTDADKQTAIQQGTVFVSGNYSQTHGGGIMSNGILILGQAKDITLSPGLEIEVYKAFKDANGNELDQQPGQFQFLLQDSNRNTIATVSNNAFGMVLAEQDYKQAGTYTYYLKEQPGSNPLITYDSTEYQITVTVGTKTKTLNLSENQSMTITYYVVTDIRVSLSSGTGTVTAATGNIGSDNHRATVVIGKDSGKAFTNTMNEKPLYFRITKLNGHTNEPLQFVEFTLKDENGNVVTSSKTDKDGHVSLQIEKGKNYRLYETTYQDFMPAGPWILEVDKDGNAKIYDTTTGADGSINKSGEGTACTKEEKDVAVYYDHTILNLIAGCELPETGGAGTAPYTMGGVLLLTGAAFLLLYNHTKRRKEDSTSS